MNEKGSNDAGSYEYLVGEAGCLPKYMDAGGDGRDGVVRI